MSELSFENVLIQVKDALQTNGIKLWEKPYFDLEPVQTEMLNLANNLVDTLNIKYDYLLAALNELQSHAVDKLKSNLELKSIGLATLKVKFSSKKVTCGPKHKLFDIKIKLTEDAMTLRKLVASQLNLSENRVKLISTGKVLDMSQQSLRDHGVRNFQHILALEIEVDEEQATAESQPYDRIQKIRKDAEVLLKAKNNDYFKLENQNGEAVHLPESERIALMMALLLYEKGRVQLKNENYNDALILFLEADSEIQNCHSPIIKSVDNIALLNLDIVWCYLQLKSITQLPDAERRLQLCESSFKRTYGENFERVKMLKDSEMSEKCLIVRLKLLKAVLYFHQNRRIESSSYLAMAEQEILQLKVDDEKVNALIEMGYKSSEAIIALRNTYNTSIDAAVNFILERRSKLSNARDVGRKERVVARFLENMGFDVNPKSVCTLSEMGFSRELSALALHKSQNDIPQAISMLQNQNDLLKLELIKFIKPDPKLLEQLRTFGFDRELAENILKINANNFDAALDVLLKMRDDDNFQVPPELLNLFSDLTSSDGATPSTSTANEESSTKKMKIDNEISPEDEKAIFDDLSNDLNHLAEDDEYLTITFDNELALVYQYKAAIGK